MFSTGEISFDPRPMFIADLFQSPYPASDAIFYYDNTMIHCKEDPDGPTRLSSMDLPTPDPTDKVNAAVVVVSNCEESATWRSAYIDKQIAAEQYRFFISIENSLVTNYFTEKFLEALDYDTVVVYGGPPDAKAHFPSPNSFVDVLDFPDPADLAAFLNAMTDDEWRSRFEWRKKASVQPKLAELARKRGCLSRPKWTACAMCRAYHDVFDYEPTVG
ncbi:Alpha3-fucosyltransferase [Thecamonas trahens ATCC 50062]|uniref:Fucosyltransferase n=1 Tax=Thecamonas trahens ATCC 50062 TaxID=461836 RepID=A0A0L0DBQ3_THETB|nr:Alpha3-fucosyltransferase [Thecamonas trahens ATCC 50062]KNC49660.1 Alpha3-fucosyltransferase [Thecamonas trahens ATCC 50062]|eukprot:XP_013757459.1 Alpha3-fucosyltransferase [Thecamonas trahens ATCC 50062]